MPPFVSRPALARQHTGPQARFPPCHLAAAARITHNDPIGPASTEIDMNPPLAPLVPMFQTHNHLVAQFAERLSNDQWLARIGDASNAYWILGHLVGPRFSLLNALGDSADPPHWCRPAFAQGAEPPTRIDPPVADLLAAFNDAGQRLIARLPDVPPERLQADAGRELPNGQSSVEGLVYFLYFHEAYHLGQIALLLRAQGLPTLGR